MKKKLLIVGKEQFGYHISSVQYCKYLKADFDITYLCLDYGMTKIYEEVVDIKYVSRNGNMIQRYIRFISAILEVINKQRISCIFINYFKGCSIIPFIYRRKYRIHLNIVSGNVSPKLVSRKIYNFLLSIESYFFNRVFIISEGLKKLLNVSRHALILPLGANPLYVKRQNKHRIHLLYVGTFTYRRLEDTIKGLKLFLEKLPHANIYYTIIGNGLYKEEDILLKFVNQFDLQDYIELTGYIPNNELYPYFEKANVGVSYIPLTAYYEFQPATKTYEYLMAGMPVIATKTYENSKVINHINGVLISDNAKSFAEGIEKMYNHSNLFDENEIRFSVQNYTWSLIVNSMKDSILAVK